MMRAAFLARPFTHRQSLRLGVLITADMAKLAARIPLVYLDELFALPSQLIFQHVREQIPAIVRYGFAKTELAALLALRHRLNTDILHADCIIAVGKITCFLVQKITSLVGNFLMDNSHTFSLLFPVMAFLLLFRKLALCLCQLSLAFAQKIRISGIILIRGNIKSVHRKIQPKKILRYDREYLVFILHQDTDVIFSGSFLAYGYSLYNTVFHKRAMQADFHPADLWQLYLVAFQPD